MVRGAFSQWAETTRTALGRGKALAQAASWATHSGSSTSGGAPWPMYKVGMRPEALALRARSATVLAAASAGSSGALAACGFNSSSMMAPAIVAQPHNRSFGMNFNGRGQVTSYGMAADYAVHAEGLVKNYGRVRALDGLDLDVA